MKNQKDIYNIEIVECDELVVSFKLFDITCALCMIGSESNRNTKIMLPTDFRRYSANKIKILAHFTMI